jgi:hypothetical protein
LYSTLATALLATCVSSPLFAGKRRSGILEACEVVVKNNSHSAVRSTYLLDRVQPYLFSYLLRVDVDSPRRELLATGTGTGTVGSYLRRYCTSENGHSQYTIAPQNADP